MTITVFLVTGYVVARNLIHAFEIRVQISSLNDERIDLVDRIARDSTLMQQLRYDDYLEQYAREKYHLQRRGEEVFLIKER